MEVKTDYRVSFQKLKDKKIFIYGTGVISKRVINALSDFRIVGVIDRMRFLGEVEGIPIKMWDEVKEGDAEAVIIASLPRNYYDIYHRIIDRCIAYDMKIYGADGRNLISYFGININSKANVNFFKKNENELLELISRYEAISFDLFDTLIMRKNLEPADLFDIVAMRIREKGIFISDFKKERREADIRAKGSDIYNIYNILQQMTNISDEERKIVLEEEIKCEKECIIPRKKMVEIMEGAYRQGKKIFIITNMYFPENIIKNILQEKGITAYDKIYVSCDYGVSKGNGLFKEYLQNIEAKNYLHIGDDKIEDIDAARRCGIDTYEIKSAYEMLKISNMRRTLVEVHNSSEKGLLGLIISELFNNPFALYETSGIIKITNKGLLGKIFVGPIVILYMLKLMDLINDKNDCDGILFSSRDGYLFKKLYDDIQIDRCNKKFCKIPAWYFMASRKLCLRASMKTEDDIKTLKGYINGKGAENVLVQVLDVTDCLPYVDNRYEDAVAYYVVHKEKIMMRSGKTRENYYKYMEKNNIKKDGKYVFCDLMSHGTVQYSLNQILEKPTYGFYLCRVFGEDSFEIEGYSCYQVMQDDLVNAMVTANNIFLESILTSPEPSVEDMDEVGDPVFGMECRTEQEIEDIQCIQKGIEDFFQEYMSMMYIQGETIKEELPELLLEMHNYVWLEDECKEIGKRKYYDDFLEEYACTFKDNFLTGQINNSKNIF